MIRRRWPWQAASTTPAASRTRTSQGPSSIAAAAETAAYATHRARPPRVAPVRCQLAGTRLAPAWTATGATAAPAPAAAPITAGAGCQDSSSTDRPRMTIRPGTMKQTPPSSPPTQPRSRQAQKIASWVEAGPGSRLVAAMPSSNSWALIQPRFVTHSCRRRLMCAGGPPNPVIPIRVHCVMIVRSDTCGGWGPVVRSSGSDGWAAVTVFHSLGCAVVRRSVIGPAGAIMAAWRRLGEHLDAAPCGLR
ncbi:hypothetical protein GCM10027610_059620 [Dactylosporangium cerinum]